MNYGSVRGSHLLSQIIIPVQGAVNSWVIHSHYQVTTLQSIWTRGNLGHKFCPQLAELHKSVILGRVISFILDI